MVTRREPSTSRVPEQDQRRQGAQVATEREVVQEAGTHEGRPYKVLFNECIEGEIFSLRLETEPDEEIDGDLIEDAVHIRSSATVLSFLSLP